MARCIVCGRKLVTEESIQMGIGKGCLRKGKKVSNRWASKVERTMGFANGKFTIGNTNYEKISPTCWSDGKHVYDKEMLKDWLERKGQILLSDDVPNKIYDLLIQGNSVKEILDKIQEV
jgi:hypothetical protein